MLTRVLPALVALVLLSSVAYARPIRSEQQAAQSFPPPPVRAAAAVVLDAATGRVMMSVNPYRHLPMASTTKMMTALLAIQMGKLTDRITVPASAFNFESDATVMGLKPGEVVTLKDLLYGLLLPSGADAANTIAIHYAGSEARFVQMMNDEAAKLGLHDTHYATPHGLTAPNQYSSAYDLARLGADISRIPTLMQIVGTRTYMWNGYTLTNVNHVLFWYPGVDGIKPGYTYEAGLCQVLDAHRDGRHVVVAILNTPDLVIDARNLLNYGLNDFSWITSPLPGDSPAYVQSGVDSGGSFLYYPAAGHYIRGSFRSAFISRGGLSALGYPRSEQLVEGSLRVQYYQNGVLAMDRSGQIKRLPLGLTPLPAATPTPTNTPRPTVSTPHPTPTPHEQATRQKPPAPAPTPSPPYLFQRRQSQPPPAPPTVSQTPPAPSTPSPPSAGPAAQFSRFYRQHAPLLGATVGPAGWTHGYLTQLFAYGALVYDPHGHAVSLLPIGDRLLAARGFLPSHPGNVYPAGYAPPSVLKAIGWLPGMPQQSSHRT